jgi:glutaredoxin-like YruB-family protein
MHKVNIYTLPTCHHCHHAKEFLSQKGVEYVEFDVSKNRDALDEMTRISGARSVPVIVGCENVVVGFDEHRLEAMISCMKNRTDLPLAA